MKSIILGSILVALTIAAGCTITEDSLNLADPNVPGKVLAQQVCAICHGVDGNSTNPTFPKLAGQQEWYLIAQLTEFRSHKRSDPAGSEYMWGITRHLTDTQIQQLASYFAQQKPISAQSEHTQLENDGKSLFAKGNSDRSLPACATCHGEKGEGSSQFARIAGQHADYTAKQLHIFKETDARPDSAAMKAITNDLTPNEIDAVAAYVATISEE